MKKYFTSLEVQNNLFIATLFDANTNQELFKSNPCNSQSKAMKEVNAFITNQKPIENGPPKPQTFINTAQYKPVPGVPQKRCCGR